MVSRAACQLPSRERPKGAPEAGGRWRPGVSPVTRGDPYQFQKSQTWADVLVARSLPLGRVAEWGFGGWARREAAEFPFGLTGCQSPPAPVPEEAKPATQKGMTLPGNFPSRTPDSPGLETAAARVI